MSSKVKKKCYIKLKFIYLSKYPSFSLCTHTHMIFMRRKDITLSPPSICYNQLAHKLQHAVRMADIGAYKGPCKCISKHSMFSDIIGKAANLFDFDKSLIVMARPLEASVSEKAR